MKTIQEPSRNFVFWDSTASFCPSSKCHPLAVIISLPEEWGQMGKGLLQLPADSGCSIHSKTLPQYPLAPRAHRSQRTHSSYGFILPGTHIPLKHLLFCLHCLPLKAYLKIQPLLGSLLKFPSLTVTFCLRALPDWGVLKKFVEEPAWWHRELIHHLWCQHPIWTSVLWGTRFGCSTSDPVLC